MLLNIVIHYAITTLPLQFDVFLDAQQFFDDCINFYSPF